MLPDPPSTDRPVFATVQMAVEAGMVIEQTLTPYQRLAPGIEPAGWIAIPQSDPLPCWLVSAIQPLRSRKSWKKRNRRILPGTPPAREVALEGRLQALYSLDQTLSATEYLFSQKDHYAAECCQWNAAWESLLAALTDWHASLSVEPGDRSEAVLREMLEERRRLLAHREMLTEAAAVLALPLHPATDHATWQTAIHAYTDYRFRSALESQDDPLLAAQIDAELHRQEHHHPTECRLTPYWKYYNAFRKAMESARFERRAADVTRIREFHALFQARRQPRHFTLYLGPTNSGKTYQALRRLIEAPRGIYLAPLRLLALEVASTLHSWGVPCHMVTGEERILAPGANHTASTIEMLPRDAHYDLCVIDEVQMLGDPERGWAWTQAILGVCATEVCLVGAPESRPVVEKLLRLTGESYQVVELSRLTPLHLLDRPVQHLDELTPGTALVAFSRTAVLGLKGTLERKTGQPVAVLYGALPPEVRRQQARLFAEGEAPFLAATDAIGMGLNLPIRTLLFAEDHKFIAQQELPLTPTSVRQIAGRAGRFGKNEVGWVGTYRIPDHHIRNAFLADPPRISRAYLAPNLEQLLAIADLKEDHRDGSPRTGSSLPSLSGLFTLFAQRVKPDPEVYRMSDLEDQIFLARTADRYPALSLETRFALSAAPVPLRSFAAVTAFSLMVECVARNRPITIARLLPTHSFQDEPRLTVLESSMQVVNLYSWLHYRFEAIFPDLKEAERQRREINQRINELLSRQAKSEGVCSECRQPLPPFFRFPICEDCWTVKREHRVAGEGTKPSSAPYHRFRRRR